MQNAVPVPKGVTSQCHVLGVMSWQCMTSFPGWWKRLTHKAARACGTKAVSSRFSSKEELLGVCVVGAYCFHTTGSMKAVSSGLFLGRGAAAALRTPLLLLWRLGASRRDGMGHEKWSAWTSSAARAEHGISLMLSFGAAPRVGDPQAPPSLGFFFKGRIKSYNQRNLAKWICAHGEATVCHCITYPEISQPTCTVISFWQICNIRGNVN